MSYTKLLMSVSAVVTALACIWGAIIFYNSLYSSSSSTGYPKVNFKSAATYDMIACPLGSRRFLPPEFDNTFLGEMRLLQQTWDEESYNFLKTTVMLIGDNFAGQEQNIYLHRCHLHYGWSNPTLLPGYLLLLSEPNSVNSQLRREQLEDLTFHELLHPLILRLLLKKKGSPFLRKYRNESLLVLFHLHPFAVQKAVYLQLGKIKRWEQLKEREQKSLPGYSRAIDIIEKEGYREFLNELSK